MRPPFVARGTDSYASVGAVISTYTENIFPFLLLYIVNEVMIYSVREDQQKDLSVETVIRGGNILFRTFRLFAAFQIIQNNLRLRINAKKEYEMYIERKWNVSVLMSKQ
jgi:hypothetical protein